MTTAEEEGRAAITQYQTLSFHENLSLIKVTPKTGRTHQIRVHMKHLGSPVLGDSSYGNPQVNKKYGVDRQMLHAEVLKFKHPLTGQDLEFRADIPDDMKNLIHKCKLRKL